MSATYNPYKYSITMKWNNSKGDVIDIPDTAISNVIIDYDYDNKNMPIILVDCNISKKLLDDMIKQREDSTIIFNIKKFSINNPINTNDIKIKQNYINDEFIYFLQNDVNYNKDVEYDDDSDYDIPEHLYERTMIGLMNLRLINNNKQLVNHIYRNVTKTDIILINTSHMPLLLEPLDNDKNYNEFIMPPISSLSKLLKYIDDKHMLYSTPYRYFLDFDRSYILSSSGKNVQANDEIIKNIIFNIDNPVDRESKIQGVNIDNSTHIIEIDGSFIKYFKNNITDTLYNNIIGIDSEGNMLSEDVDTIKIKNSNKKTNIVRVENLDSIKLMKQKIELSTVSLQIIKNDIDCSVFTINKEYYVNNIVDNIEHNGLYLLSRKQEIFSRERENFIINNKITLKKI